jgi:hypothetical protein
MVITGENVQRRPIDRNPEHLQFQQLLSDANGGTL